MRDLDWGEINVGAYGGMMRRLRHKSRGDADRYIIGNWTSDIEANTAEKHVAKQLGLYHHDGIKGETDVGPFQVRHTLREDGKLLIRPKDKDGEAFILVTGAAPDYEIRGWCWGHEGKVKENWDEETSKNHPDGPAFFVPQAKLRRIEPLIAAAARAVASISKEMEASERT